jgi:hypothetical protein
MTRISGHASMQKYWYVQSGADKTQSGCASLIGHPREVRKGGPRRSTDLVSNGKSDYKQKQDYGERTKQIASAQGPAVSFRPNKADEPMIALAAP